MTDMAYVAKKPCGCICSAVVDEPNHKRDVAKDVAEWIREGLTIEHVTVQHVRENFVGWQCPHEPVAPEQMPLFSAESEK